MGQPRVNVRFPLEVYHAIKDVAKETDSNMSAVIEVAVVAYLESLKKK